MTATRASPGPSSGTGTSSRWIDLRGSLSRVSRPANISVSSLWTVMARYDSGSGRAAKSAGVESGDWIASRISFTVTVLPPANGVLREDAEGYVGAVGSAVMLFGSALWRGRLPVTQASGRASGGPPRPFRHWG